MPPKRKKPSDIAESPAVLPTPPPKSRRRTAAAAALVAQPIAAVVETIKVSVNGSTSHAMHEEKPMPMSAFSDNAQPSTSQAHQPADEQLIPIESDHDHGDEEFDVNDSYDEDEEDVVEHRTRRKTRKNSVDDDDLEDVKDSKDFNHSFSTSRNRTYLPYCAHWKWNPLYTYRLPHDITLSDIRASGSEGTGRIEIGRTLGMDTATKSGNRRVSAYIVTACKENPKHVGQFQKMDGKVRCIKYYWKADSDPANFKKLYAEFEAVTGRPCPFTMGQVIKFPNTKLSTLRLSDVTMRRLNDLVTEVRNRRVIVTIHKIIKIIHHKEQALGYDFQIDKKTTMKMLKALEKENLLRVFSTVVKTDIENTIQIVCHPSIESASSDVVTAAVQETIDEYNKEGRVFPHGQLRFSVKRRDEMAKQQQQQKEEEEKLHSIDPTCTGPITLEQRFELLRVQTSRISAIRADSSGAAGSGEKATKAKSSGVSADVALSRANNLLGAAIPSSFTKKGGCDLNTEYGYQAKMIRCAALHELVFQLTRALPDGVGPTAWERFPPGLPPIEWPELQPEDIPVYVNEESSNRFIPPYPQMEGLERGWLMIQDLLPLMPLSVFTLCVNCSKILPRDEAMPLLRDPIRRHTLIGDLPRPLRATVMKDKRAYRQLEHLMLTLAAFGLAVIAPNPDPKRFPSSNCSVFHVVRDVYLLDTSTSNRGYATVSQPMEQYQRYDYQLKTQEDVALYWNHLRAIVQSTPLAFRNDMNMEETQLNRHKKFSMGLFDRKTVEWPVDLPVEGVEPLHPHDGCAGFDSSLYVHLKRHWDLNPRPSSLVAWFITRWRHKSDRARVMVEKSVAKLQTDWNSFVKTLMPSDLELTKKKKAKVSEGGTMFPSRAVQTLAIEPKTMRRPNGTMPKKQKHKKRPLDHVDMVSQQTRVHVRSRFNARERDMLILIRAVGFFLNPVYRFWIDPAVLRDIMHEYVPESRSKTVQSLMAAGVREMVRPHRLAYLQRIVRNLTTFPEMRALRMQLAQQPLSSQESKTAFFKQAFSAANRVLFFESHSLPPLTASEAVFDAFISSGEVVIAAEQTSGAPPMPLRSQKAISLAHIHHCVAINVLTSVLMHSSSGLDSEDILTQLNASVIHNALQVLRSDGLVSRTRVLDPLLMTTTKNNASLSYYYRHFFAHRFHPELVEQCVSVLAEAEERPDGHVSLDIDDAGAVIIASSAFYHRCALEVAVDESILEVFDQAGDQLNTTKQIRYLENTDLRLENITVLQSSPDVLPELASADELVAKMDRWHSLSADPGCSWEEWLAGCGLPAARKKLLKRVYTAVDALGPAGACEDDLHESLSSLDPIVLSECVSELLSAYQLMECGVDVRRWVTRPYFSNWSVSVCGRRGFPRPWTKPDGTICISTVRWMAESVVMMVVAKPGIPIKDLRVRFEFALQPSLVDELVCVLEEAGCLTRHREHFVSSHLASPFDECGPVVCVDYVLPCVDAVERFARIFGRIPLLPVIHQAGVPVQSSASTPDRHVTMSEASGLALDKGEVMQTV